MPDNNENVSLVELSKKINNLVLKYETYIDMELKQIQGPKGDKGDKGEDGTVSFDQLTDNQREMLRGPKGDKGDKGDTGPQGPKGDKGDRGTDGTVTFEALSDEQKASLKGEKGEDGKDGLNGIPFPPNDNFCYAISNGEWCRIQNGLVVKPTVPGMLPPIKEPDWKLNNNISAGNSVYPQIINGTIENWPVSNYPVVEESDTTYLYTVRSGADLMRKTVGEPSDVLLHTFTDNEYKPIKMIFAKDIRTLFSFGLYGVKRWTQASQTVDALNVYSARYPFGKDDNPYIEYVRDAVWAQWLQKWFVCGNIRTRDSAPTRNPFILSGSTGSVVTNHVLDATEMMGLLVCSCVCPEIKTVVFGGFCNVEGQWHIIKTSDGVHFDKVFIENIKLGTFANYIYYMAWSPEKKLLCVVTLSGDSYVTADFKTWHNYEFPASAITSSLSATNGIVWDSNTNSFCMGGASFDTGFYNLEID